MTIESAGIPRHDYPGDGIQSEFPYTFRIFSPSDLEVYQGELLLTLFTHYTVTGVGEPGGGNVVLVAPVPAGTTLTILSAIPAIQGTDLREGDALPAETVEQQLDRHTRLIQQILETLGRIPKLRRLSRFAELELPDPVVGKILGWRTDLAGLENQDKAPKGDTGPQGPQGPPGAGAAPAITDGSTTVPAPSSILFPAADGFTVADDGGGVARVNHQQPAIPPGVVVPYAAAAAPTGWLLCDGAAVSRTTYADLFAAIGVAFGAGDGATTFNVPDLRGRFPLGAGIGPGLTTRSLAAQGGEETHVLTTSEMPSHAHSVPHQRGAIGGGGGTLLVVAIPGTGDTAGTNAAILTGGGQAHNTMPPFTALTHLIKT